ncbi:MAG: propionyl-CoA synthetase [Candidatus Marinimicrobia bacterium]|nr:propionyl-CoA synthetase [Candidatus Neomarinimicrobiota bacterium]
MSYQFIYKESLEIPEKFWLDQARKIQWFKSPEKILSQDDRGFYSWFEGGTLNTCYLALDKHVADGRGNQPALIYDSPVTEKKKTFNYEQLLDQTSLFAGALADLGVGKGDRVIVYMPMVPEAVIAMLACARLGAIHSVVFGGFAANELAIRIDDAKPKVIVSATCGIEFSKVIPYKPLLDSAIEAAEHKPAHTIILKRPQAECTMEVGRDHDWCGLMNKALPHECVPVRATDPLYILYTSGTTGKPKGIVRDNGGHAVALNYSMEAIYDVNPGDVYWTASDVGWVVGHSYIVYAPLIRGCTTILFEGKPVRTPDPGAFWRVMSEYKVKSFFTAPTAFRAIKKEDSEGKCKDQYDLSTLESVFLAGERLDPPTYEWLSGMLACPVIDHWWQTETGWPICANMLGMELKEIKMGSATVPVPGFDVKVLDKNGKETEAGDTGSIVIKLPLPPGCLPTLWDDDERYKNSYVSDFPGFYLTGDGGYKDEDGYVFVMGRTDDVINVAGHRLSTGEMEELIGGHEAVAECAVVGIEDEMKGQVPAGFVVLKDGYTIENDVLVPELVQIIRSNIGAIANFKQAAIVNRLPKTRSGKILRKTIRSLADKGKAAIPSTIDDPAILNDLKEILKQRKIGVAFQN